MRHIVLVAGVDYAFRGKGVDFRVFCDSRVRRLTNANTAKQDTTFTIFDVRRGEVASVEVSYPKGKKIIKRSSSVSFTPLTKGGSFDAVPLGGGEIEYRLKTGLAGVMSVTDVYQKVRTIGSTDPGTLAELSFFSHAYFGGPILVNSYESAVYQASAARDPDDRDPRPAKDFAPPTMDAVALKHFKDAFHLAGYSWVWGCTFPRTIHEVLYKVEHHRDYRPAGLGDDTLLVFTNFRKEHVDQLEGWLKPLIGAFPDPKRVELRFKHIKYAFCLFSQASYMSVIARVTGVPAFGANVGTYADYDTGALPLMHVHPSFAAHLRFYKNYLGFTFDPEKRRYAKYLPGLACPAPP